MLDNGDAWWFDVNPLAKIGGCIVELLVSRSGPEIQVVALRLTFETTVRVLRQVYGERATTRRGRAVNRTCAS